MKHFVLLAAVFLRGTVFLAAAAGFNWSLFWSGSWEENRTLHNRGEIRLSFPLHGLVLRGGVLDRRTMNFELDPPWGEPEKWSTNFTSGLYHGPTGSRLLYGVLDEWGLPARIRNPWIRSAPYAENHRPIIADLRTAASSTRKDELYLYLSSPFLYLHRSVRLRGFVSAQTELEAPSPAFAGGLDFALAKNSNILLETFYTQATLPPTRSSTWFSAQPPLPERDFRLSAVGFLYDSPGFSAGSDLAYSETFAKGRDIYGNLGICITPLLPFGTRTRPLSVSFAADGAGQRFVYRDGGSYGAGFRGAGKVEWRGIRSSLFWIDTVLRSPGIGGDFNRSSSGFYYRFPARTRNDPPVKLTRMSLSVDRNAVNPEKITDGLSGNLGISLFFPQMAKTGHVGINFSGSIKGLTSYDGIPPPYPVPAEPWVFDTSSAACEFIWSPRIFQFRSKVGYTAYAKKENNWDISLSAAARFRRGRLSIRLASPVFPEKWNWTVSWRLEKR